MKNTIIIVLAVFLFLNTRAQKKLYFSIDAGPVFNPFKKQLVNGLHASGFNDRLTYDFFGLFSSSTQYPVVNKNSMVTVSPKIGYRLNKKLFIEAAFQPPSHVSTSGCDVDAPFYSNNVIDLETKYKRASLLLLWSNSGRKTGLGAGPSVGFLQFIVNKQSYNTNRLVKKFILPGFEICAFWNFIQKEKFFVGVRSDCAINAKAKTKELTLDNGAFKSTLKSMDLGGVSWGLRISAGLNF